MDKKTVSQLKNTDILCAYRPELPTIAIVDTALCHVEQILMLTATSEQAVPQQAFVVVAPDGTRFMECDCNAADYNGTAWVLRPLSHWITEAQLRFWVKNIITSLQGDFVFDVVLHHIVNSMERHHLEGLKEVDSRFPISMRNINFTEHVRQLCTAVRDEIADDVANTTPNS